MVSFFYVKNLDPAGPSPKRKVTANTAPCLPAASVRYGTLYFLSFVFQANGGSSKCFSTPVCSKVVQECTKSCFYSTNEWGELQEGFRPALPRCAPLFGHSSWKELCFPLRFLPVLGDFSRDCSLTSFLSYFIIYLTDRRPRPADNFMPAQVPPAHGGIQCEVGCNSRAIPLLCRWSAPLGGHWFSKLGRLGRAVKPSQKTAFAGRMFHFLRGNRE